VGLLAAFPAVGPDKLGLETMDAVGPDGVTPGAAKVRDGMEGELVEVHDIRASVASRDGAGGSEGSRSQDGDDGELHNSG